MIYNINSSPWIELDTFELLVRIICVIPSAAVLFARPILELNKNCRTWGIHSESVRLTF